MTETTEETVVRDEQRRMSLGQGVAVGAIWAAMAALQGFVMWLAHIDDTDWEREFAQMNIVAAVVVFVLLCLAYYLPLILAWLVTKRIVRRVWEA